jgi:hypothetical protein
VVHFARVISAVNGFRQALATFTHALLA